MADKDAKPRTDSRTEQQRRLAEALRANLHRRKAQARAKAEKPAGQLPPRDERDPGARGG
jgi:hypothetical protein